MELSDFVTLPKGGLEIIVHFRSICEKTGVKFPHSRVSKSSKVQ